MLAKDVTKYLVILRNEFIITECNKLQNISIKFITTNLNTIIISDKILTLQPPLLLLQ